MLRSTSGGARRRDLGVAEDDQVRDLAEDCGVQYTVTAEPGAFTFGGTMWVRSVTPGGGYLPAGTVLRLTGGGFDATTKVAVEERVSRKFAAQGWIQAFLFGKMPAIAPHGVCV